MDKIFKTLDSINAFSKKIILGASMFAVAGCNIGIVLIVYNKIFANEVELYTFGSTLIIKSISVFAHFIIAALLMDWFKNAFQNDD